MANLPNPNESDADAVMTFNEVMLFLKISRPTLGEILKRGEMPARKLGNQWRFSRQAVIDYLSGKDYVSRSRRTR